MKFQLRFLMRFEIYFSLTANLNRIYDLLVVTYIRSHQSTVIRVKKSTMLKNIICSNILYSNLHNQIVFYNKLLK